jgi:hypothetical protein
MDSEVFDIQGEKSGSTEVQSDNQESENPSEKFDSDSFEIESEKSEETIATIETEPNASSELIPFPSNEGAAVHSKTVLPVSSSADDLRNSRLIDSTSSTPAAKKLSVTFSQCERSPRPSTDAEADEIIPAIPACLRRSVAPQKDEGKKPKSVTLAISQPKAPAKPEDEELRIEDLSASIIAPDHIPRAHQLTMTPVVVQKSIRPRKPQPSVLIDPPRVEPEPPKTPRVPPPRYSTTFITTPTISSRYGTGRLEMVDQNYLNVLESTKLQLQHIHQSIHAARRLRALRESAAFAGFEYTTNPFAPQ